MLNITPTFYYLVAATLIVYIATAPSTRSAEKLNIKFIQFQEELSLFPSQKQVLSNVNVKAGKLEHITPLESFNYVSTGFSCSSTSLFKEKISCPEQPGGSSIPNLVTPSQVFALDLNSDGSPEVITISKHRHFTEKTLREYGFFSIATFKSEVGKLVSTGDFLLIHPYVDYREEDAPESVDYKLKDIEVWNKGQTAWLCASIEEKKEDMKADGAPGVLSFIAKLHCWKFENNKMVSQQTIHQVPTIDVRFDRGSFQKFISIPENDSKEPGTGLPYSRKSDWTFKIAQDGKSIQVSGRAGTIVSFLDPKPLGKASPPKISERLVGSFKKSIPLPN